MFRLAGGVCRLKYCLPSQQRRLWDKELVQLSKQITEKKYTYVSEIRTWDLGCSVFATSASPLRHRATEDETREGRRRDEKMGVS